MCSSGDPPPGFIQDSACDMPHFTYQRRVPFTAASVFDLVADVESYPLFLPGWQQARILHRHDDVLTVEQTLGFWGLTWHFRTRATLHRPELIRIETEEYPFEHLLQIWRFEPVDGGTLASLDADYALGNLPARGLVTKLVRRGFRETLEAFEKRAHELFD